MISNLTYKSYPIECRLPSLNIIKGCFKLFNKTCVYFKCKKMVNYECNRF